jgi:hypothetical protein
VVGEAGLEPTTPGLEGLSRDLSPFTQSYLTLLRFNNLWASRAFDAYPYFLPFCREGPHKIPHSPARSRWRRLHPAGEGACSQLRSLPTKLLTLKVLT